MAHLGKILPAMKELQEMPVQSLGQEDSLEEEMAMHSSILAWEIPWAEEPGGLQFMGSQRVGYNLATEQWTFLLFHLKKASPKRNLLYFQDQNSNKR